MNFFEEWRKHAKEERNTRLMRFITQKCSIMDMTPDSQRSIQLNIARVS